MAPKLLNDHVWMLKPSGEKKLVPIDTINFWKANGITRRVGYTYVDEEKALKDIEAYNTARREAAADSALTAGTVVRDGGPAEAHTKVGGAPAVGPIAPKDLGETHVPERPVEKPPGEEEVELEIKDSFEE